MDAKTYQIDNIDFTIKEDFTLDETEELQKIFGKLEAGVENVITGKFTNSDIKKMLAILLESEQGLPKDFNFGKAKESVVLEIIKAFFLSRIRSIRNMPVL